MKAGAEYGFLVGLLCGLGITYPAMGPVALALLTLHFVYGALRMLWGRLWFSAASSTAAIIAFWTGWDLAVWPPDLRSGRLLLALLAAVSALLLHWAQRTRTPQYMDGRDGISVTDLLIFRWVTRPNLPGS